MVQTRLASTVCEGLESRDSQSINASKVNDARGITGYSSFLQQRCDKSCDIEDTVEVQGKDSGPGRGWVFIVRGTPVRARVVDEDVKL